MEKIISVEYESYIYCFGLSFYFMYYSDVFLIGSPNAMTQDIDGNNGNIATDGSSVLKTTHIVIHKQAALKPDAVSPITPVAPPTPATPSTREHGFQYQWDQTAFDPVIPVRCKSSNGDLHKAKFGSGMLYRYLICM